MGFREYQALMREQREIEQQQQLGAAPQSREFSYSQSAVDIALKMDVDKIRSMPSLAQRTEYKRDHFLPKWLEFVDRYIQEGKVYDNLAIGYCMVYSFDCGDWQKAFQLMELAIREKQNLPEHFHSANVPSFVANFVFDWANKVSSQGQSCEPYFSQILQKVHQEWNLHEMARAKWYKLAAQLLLRNEDGQTHAAAINEPERLQQALALLGRAFELNTKSGVKSLMERCLMRLSALDKEGIETNANPGGLPQQAHAKINLERVIELLKAPPLSLNQVKKQQRETDLCSTEETQA